MKRFLGLALSLVGLSVFATNGSHFIGVSPAATALGGTGVGHFTNVIDGIDKNPALLTDSSLGIKSTSAEASFLLISNNVSSSAANATASAGLKASSAPAKLSPSFAAHYGLDEHLHFALGLVSFGGATVDQVGAFELNQLRTRNSLIRLSGVVAYKINDEWSVAVEPYLAYASLSINHSSPLSTPGATQTSRPPHGAAGFGGKLGATFRPVKELTLGVAYNSKSNVTYKQVLDLDAFGPAPSPPLDDIAGQEPQEFAFGAGYQVSPDFTVTADYRFINWNSAKAFTELGWQNQHVVAVGAQYRWTGWKFRAGFNYGQSPIRDVAGETNTTPVDFQGHKVLPQSITNLNLIAFPAVTETHITVGAGYEVNKELNLDVAFALAPKKTVIRSGAGIDPLVGGLGAYTMTTQVSQWSIGLGATYRL